MPARDIRIQTLDVTVNSGLLPDGYYPLAEQHAGRTIADALTLHFREARRGGPLPPLPEPEGGVAVAEAPPNTRRKRVVETGAGLRRSLAIRHVSGHRLIALIEIVWPANKDRSRSVSDFAEKVESSLMHGVHVLMVDLFPPGPYDPAGMHGAILQCLEHSDTENDLPTDEPLTMASYVAERRIEIYLEHLAVGGTMIEMPLFLTPERYVNVPLEATYAAAFCGMPRYWRDVLEQTV